MNITQRTLTASAIIAATALTLGACGSSKPRTPTASPTDDATASTSAASSGASSADAAPGYRPGEIPSIPLFSLPPVDVFASNADKAVIQSASSSLSSVPGVKVSAAKCDGNTVVTNGGSTVLYGDGSGYSRSGDKGVTNYGDGSGTITDGPITLVYYGDGSGNYTNSETNERIVVYPDGSGNYSSPTLRIVSYGDGSGLYENSATGDNITIYTGGSGNYSNSKTGVSIVNYGDGSGNYSDATGLSIHNYGDGTANVNGKSIKADPVPAGGSVGSFPPIGSLKPVESCGTLITLEDGVLFDFGKSDIRPDAAQTLKKLAGVLTDAKVPTAHVYGHTDSVSDEAFNQKLSEDRANAVSAELKKDGVSATLDATGYGETKPIAPNENPDGSDNPSGRALNRRVEIFIPAF